MKKLNILLLIISIITFLLIATTGLFYLGIIPELLLNLSMVIAPGLFSEILLITIAATTAFAAGTLVAMGVQSKKNNKIKDLKKEDYIKSIENFDKKSLKKIYNNLSYKKYGDPLLFAINNYKEKNKQELINFIVKNLGFNVNEIAISILKKKITTELKSEIMTILLKNKNINLNKKDKDKTTLFMWLLNSGLEKEIKEYWNNSKKSKIIDDINHVDKEGLSALFYAVNSESDKMVTFVLDKGVNINLQNKSGKTSLMEATEKKLKKIALLLINRGTDLKIKNKDGQTVFMYAASIDEIKILEELTQYIQLNELKDETERILEEEDNNGFSVLMHAVQSEKTKSIEFLKGMGVDINKQFGVKKTTPLMLAAEKNLDSAIGLLGNKDNLLLKNHLDHTALMIAAMNNSDNAIIALDKIYSKIFKRCKDRGKIIKLYEGALLLAVYFNADKAIEALLSIEGVSIDTKYTLEETTLLMAAIDGKADESVRKLINLGINVNQRNKKGQTSLDYAKSKSENAMSYLINNLSNAKSDIFIGRTV